ncbi:MAG: acyloxyacyl hydrolase [Candidatus Omnitrophica bacterium]|nr:acyloxyacyl hydrolase [Candidatus Omnitrophota bacterium]
MRLFFAFSLFLIVFSFSSVYCLELDGIEVLSGFFEANLNDRDDYQGIPLLVSFNYDAKPVFEKIGIRTEGRLEFLLEPFATGIISPESNVEVGSNFLMKYVFPLSDTFQPYFKGGLGALYMSQKTNEQSTQYNFLPQAGVGCHVFVRDDVALSMEYRYRHLSNNSFGGRNGGIDANMAMAGLSFYFQ